VFTAGLLAGYRKLPYKAGGLAIDYVRGGVDNDRKDKVEAASLKAIATPGAQVFAFGAKWGRRRAVPTNTSSSSPATASTTFMEPRAACAPPAGHGAALGPIAARQRRASSG
jgi:hypothetical protein